MMAKTSSITANRLDVRVKTELLPYLTLVRGRYWYFRWRDISIPMGEEYGTDAFLARHFQLMHLHGLATPDRRRVYFVGCETGPIKIGVAGDVEVRLARLQMGCPFPLRVFALASGGTDKEREYHRQFHAHRLHGEWFERCPEIEAEIERLNPSPVNTRD